MSRKGVIVTRGLVALALVCAFASPARAEGPFEGAWRASAINVRFDIGSWGDHCGPRPQNSRRGGGAVSIAQSGDHLTFSGSVGGGTRRCWSDTPGMRRVSSTFANGRWTTVCRTPESHAHPERGRYVLSAGGASTIRFEETTTYDWRLNESRCTATRRASRTFTRVGAEPEPEPEPTPEPEPEPEPERQTCTPGEPVAMRMASPRVDIRPGERHCVRARVVDAAGCTVRRSIRYSLQSSSTAEGSLSGRCFTAGSSAVSAEGVARIVATSGSLRAESRITVSTEDLSDLTARRERNGEGLVDGGEASSEDALGVAARALRGEGGFVWASVGCLLGFLFLGALGFFFRQRKKAREEIANRPLPDEICPACGDEFPGGTSTCPKDGAELVIAELDPDASRGLICPACRRGYGSDVTVCAHDGEELVPYGMFVEREKSGPEAQKICPTCGETYGPETTFCGKDGATLTLVE